MEINEKTKIGLFTILGVVPTAAAVIVWMTMTFFKADAAEKINLKQDEKLDAQMIILLDIRDKVSRLEERSLNRKDK